MRTTSRYHAAGIALLSILVFLALPCSLGMAADSQGSEQGVDSDSFNPTVFKPASVYVKDRFIRAGKSVDMVIVPSRPPRTYRAAAVALPEPMPSAGVNVLTVPAFDWTYGCSATAAGMIMGYYDRAEYANMYTGPTNGGVCPLDNALWGYGECSLVASHMGYDDRVTRGHVDNYWITFGDAGPDPFIVNGWPEHTPDCTADFMGTNQSSFGMTDGTTLFYFYTDGSPIYDPTFSEPDYRDGCHGMRLFVESCGYDVNVNFSQYIRGYGSDPNKGFTFDDFVNEIDAGRPVMIQVAGHSMTGVGYDTSDNTIYIHDTWDHSTHSMTWGASYAGMQHYGVSVIRLTGTPSTFTLSVRSEPVTGVVITGDYGGTTDYAESVLYGTEVTLTAPEQAEDLYFGWWQDDEGVTLSYNRTYTHTVLCNATLIAHYVEEPITGFVVTWGLNAWGQVGDGTTTRRMSPVLPLGMVDFAQIAGGKCHSLARGIDGGLHTWGSNEYGQLGDGTYSDRSSPVEIVGLEDLVDVSAGARHSLAAKSDGTVWAWGDNNSGQLGNGTTVASATPIQVPGLTGVTAVAAGAYHSVVLKSDGTVWAWGSNVWGQLGDDRGGLTMDTYIGSLTPVQVELSESVSVLRIAAGACHTLALATDGTVYAWGSNIWGQLGNGKTMDAWTPVAVSDLTDVAHVAAGAWHSLAVKDDGTLWTWGANWWGQLGDGTYFSRSRPTSWEVMSDVVHAAGGENHSLAVDSDGLVWAWGGNRHGQLGVGNTTDFPVPQLVVGPSDVESVACGAWHSLALGSGFTVTTTTTSTTTTTTSTTTTTLPEARGPDGSWGEEEEQPLLADDESKDPEPLLSVEGVGDAWDFSDLLDLGDSGSGGVATPPAPSEKAPTTATAEEAVVDNRDNSSEKRFKRLSGDWPVSDLAGGYYGRDYVYSRSRSGEENSRAQFRCTTLVAGRYDVCAWWSSRSDRATNVAYEVHHADGVTTVRADQTQNGGRWNLLGSYDFATGTHAVEIHNGLSTPGSFVCADAVRFTRTGDPTGDAPVIVSPQSSSVGTTYSVEVTESASQADSATPSLTLLAPNRAGLEIRPGTRFSVLWQSSGLPSFTPVEIALCRGGEKIRTLTITPSDGHWSWRVGYDQRGDAYTIRITALGGSANILDESDNAFVIALPGEW